MESLYNDLKQSPLIYITRDIKRALGLSLDTAGYFIVSNSTPFAKQAIKGRENVLLVEAERALDTWELMERSDVVDRLEIWKIGSVLVFKNSRKIESACQKNGWTLLNPPAEPAAKIEGKVTQEVFLPELSNLYPPHRVASLSTVICSQKSVVQYNTSHTGSGTLLIESGSHLDELKQKFPNREVRVTNYIPGKMFTNNNIVHAGGVLIGNISEQLTGLPEYTNNPFATVGNDFGTPHTLLTAAQREEYKKISHRVGEALRDKGWRGCFGIDVVCEEKTSRLYLIEINPRQTQSVVFEAGLQTTDYRLQNQITTFEGHVLAMFGCDLSKYSLIIVNSGRQIFDRKNNKIPHH